jgi:NAD(P)H-hydrate epimerase
VKIVSVAQMRALEAAAFAAGISEDALQLRAGHAVAEEVLHLLTPGERVAVLIGHGNNGRDGGVAADWLVRHQVPVELVLAPRHAIRPDELARLEAAGASAISAADASAVQHALGGVGLALDALAGIGTRGALRDPLVFPARALNVARAERGPSLQVVALDIPSGIDADTGEVPGEAVWADVTITLGGVKQGLLCFPAAERVGRLIPRGIGMPEAAEADLPYGCLDDVELARLVPPRPLDAHKYRFGRVLVIAGSDHFPGAAVLCSGGAARVGAGLITLAASRDVRLSVAAHTPEVTYTQQDVQPAEGRPGVHALVDYLGSHSSVVLGPGLGRGPKITEFVAELLEQRPREHGLVVDADGLVALSEIPDWWTRVGPNAVLTPHAGELERLVGHALSAEEPVWVQAGRLAQQWGCVLVAKGAFTCVASPDGRVDVWPRANPALATGGTGDVLAGVTAGLLAQHLQPWDAARLAVGLHGIAAERVTTRRQWRTLLASDLLEELPAALQSVAGPTPRR